MLLCKDFPSILAFQSVVNSPNNKRNRGEIVTIVAIVAIKKLRAGVLSVFWVFYCGGDYSVLPLIMMS